MVEVHKSTKKGKLVYVFLSIIIIFLVDYSIGLWQDHLIKIKEARKKELENIAYFQIFPDLANVNYKGDNKTYIIKFKIESIYQDVVYITDPQVTAYVQTGTIWTEVPIIESKEQAKNQMLEIKNGTYYFSREMVIDPSIKYTEYLMPLYMHVRFNMMFLVLPKKYLNSKDGTYEDVTTRYVDLYIYLKPYNVRNEDVLKKLKFPDNKVPIFIPMPPH